MNDFKLMHFYSMQKNSFQSVEITPPAGGVRILPPSPVTVRRDVDVRSAASASASASRVVTQTSQSHQERRVEEERVSESRREAKVSESFYSSSDSELQVSF